jgi:FtsP/CotA-like multicopper oxidase with cupredoxin domain
LTHRTLIIFLAFDGFLFYRFSVLEIISDDGVIERLVWGVNNMTNVLGKEPLIGAAYIAAKNLGWPSDISNTQLLPETPPVTWDYTTEVLAAGGPGAKINNEAEIIVPLIKGDVVEIVLQNARALNGVAEFHPWHSHGGSFWIVGRGKGVYDESLVDTYNLVNPVFRDTLTVWPLEWVAIRFVADNPGVWFFHCHITAHLVMGMGFNFVVAPDEIAEPSESVTSCQATALEPEPEQTGDSSSTSDAYSTSLMVTLAGAWLLSFVLTASW